MDAWRFPSLCLQTNKQATKKGVTLPSYVMITRGTTDQATPSSPSSRAVTAPSDSELPAAAAGVAPPDVVDVTGADEPWTTAPASRTSEPAPLRTSKRATSKSASREAVVDARTGKKKVSKRATVASTAGTPRKPTGDSGRDSDSDLEDKPPPPPANRPKKTVTSAKTRQAKAVAVAKRPAAGPTIHDLSYPEGTSINDCTDQDSIVKPEYTHCDAVATEILKSKRAHPNARACVMAGDIASAFRNISIHSNSVYLFAGHIEEDDIIVIELAAPFGWTGSPGFYEIAGCAVAYVHGSHTTDTFPNGFFNYHWVDDHINVAADIGTSCDDANRSLSFHALFTNALVIRGELKNQTVKIQVGSNEASTSGSSAAHDEALAGTSLLRTRRLGQGLAEGESGLRYRHVGHRASIESAGVVLSEVLVEMLSALSLADEAFAQHMQVDEVAGKRWV
ncbi:Secreted protein [Phytophthora cinnamomi]|uniref:Secreted protein n=1 Tax=Phytophthora cinnamomi TaxID=4785 RepID=UPI003559A4C2|nr:Secreted protein [Phytophthora cinnamomi]